MGRLFRFVHPAVLCVSALLIVASTMNAQEAPATPAPSKSQFALSQDWSSRHVIYTRNGSAEDMLKLRDDPRFLHNTLLRYLREHQAGARAAGFTGNLRSDDGNVDEKDLFVRPIPPIRSKKSNVDWSISLGPNAGMSPGEAPSIFTYNYTNPSCSNLSAVPPTVGDFAVYTINATPQVGVQANLVGITNLYTTGDATGFCPGTGPSFLFSYAIGTGGSPLSPVISLDGTRVAWIENRTATTSYLHITIWAPNEGTTAVWPAAVSGTFVNGSCSPAGSSCDDAIQYTAGTYTGCSTAFPAANGHSELYIDYSTNAGYISANNGLLYHIKNIFSTTVSPSVDFCIPVNAGFETAPSSAMSGPVYDQLHNEVFITDSETLYGFKVTGVGSSAAFVPATPPSYTFGNAASSFNYQTGPGPVLDAFNQFLYVFSTYDKNGNTSVTQVPTNLGSGVAVQLGNRTTNTNHSLFYGAFDNNYYNFGPANALSTLYSCGTDSTTTRQGLFSISFNAATGIANTTPTMSDNKNVNPGNSSGICSPISEYYDGTNDRIFVGMGQPGASTGANSVTMWKVNNRLTNTSGPGGTMPTPDATASGYLGGSSGIVPDNSAIGTAQAESIYFSTEQAGSTSTAVAKNGFNVNAIYTDGTRFSQTGGLDGDGNAYSSTLIGTTLSWNGTTFSLGAANALDGWANTTITLPSGKFSTLTILAAAVNQPGPTLQTFTVNYTDGTSTALTQAISDWFIPEGFTGESVAKTMAYRDVYDGSRDNRTFDIFGYAFAINPNKTVATLTLPATRNVVVLAGALASNCGGSDYCAVKLTQSALQ